MDSRRISDFINQYVTNKEESLYKLRMISEENGVPVIRLETESFLRTVLVLAKPKRILELGTAVGYSAIFMAKTCREYVPEYPVIDTVEDWAPRIPEAAANIEREGCGGKINLIEGDALEVMKKLTGEYDLIFIDAAKGQYPDYLDEALRLTAKGSVIIADNIFQNGEIMESKFAVERRNRTIHKRLREYLDRVTSDERLVTSIIPVGDGVTLSVRIS